MKSRYVLGIVLALLLLAVPVAVAADSSVLEDLMNGSESSSDNPETSEEATDTSSDTLIPGSNNYGYLKINSVTYNLNKEDADITVTYTMEPWISFLVMFFGKENLKERILGVLQYPEAGYNQEITFKYIGDDKTIVHITNVAVDNQESSYWFRSHSFGCTIPELVFTYPGDGKKTYTNVQVMPKGFGYFS